ncbi:MAG TPA: virulence factor [Anaerolineales bacterium]|nr:virulence factor [Anaerolineales bacterium]
MSEIQVVYWREIPAQVRARRGRERLARPLSSRFQEAIDAAAMRAGMSGSDTYLAEWRAGPWEQVDGTLEEAAERRIAEIERGYDPARLQKLTASGGLDA